MHKVETFEADEFVDIGLQINKWLKSDHHMISQVEILQIIPIPKAQDDKHGSNYQVLVVYQG